uniref:E3 ubiquitin-protein ligase RNF25 n=1 Tax=Haemonchus contortus TaxID=6289 RepID=A0A7I4YA15_HAECO|nr:RWD and Zinc finger domain containing protein [Haemonchus contortus]CDJ97082.1 RWD and Zinc finger domain containing protein [Haemonchus contortus]
MEAEAEIEALRSIFGDEISVNSNPDRSLTIVSKKVRPNDEEGVSSASIVVEFELGPKYPEVSPKVQFLNPRGISEQSQCQLVEEVSQRLREAIGTPVMFDVLQHCADFILEHQHSSSLACPICLCPLASTSVSATPCDHYVHSECLEQHVEHTRRQLGEKLAARGFKMCDDIDRSLRCPVCRVVIEEKVEPILQPSPPPGRRRRVSLKERESTPVRRLVQQESLTDFDFDWERWRQQQASLMIIYEKQKQKGGIIDLEEERKKNLVTEGTVVVLANEVEGLAVEPSVSGPVQTNEEVQSEHVELDVPPGFENAPRGGQVPHDSQKRGSHAQRGRGRGRRFNDGHYYRGGSRGRGGHREQHTEQKQRDATETETKAQDASKSTPPYKHTTSGAGSSSQQHREAVQPSSGPRRYPRHFGRYNKTGYSARNDERAPPVLSEQ